nr:MAG TPA: PsaA, PsaB, PsaC, PsaD, PsaE-LHCI, PLANT PROTEIN [Caudoviricetes sp.]
MVDGSNRLPSFSFFLPAPSLYVAGWGGWSPNIV